MIQKEAPARAEKLSSLNPAPPAIATMAKKRFEELAEIQSDLFEEIREASQNWLDRMQSEATLASDFSSKLTASQSIADTTTACQEWAKRRMELFTEDGQRLMANSQKFMDKATQFLSNGRLSNGRTGGSA
jgi:DNA replication initiation complex subunit (GINS family)